MGVWEILTRYGPEFRGGLEVTIRLCLYIWPTGIILGTMFGVTGARWKFAVGWPSRALSFALGGIPVLVLLFWLHYPLQYALGIVVDPFYTASGALAIVNTFLVADLVRGVLNEFPEQYLQAARACGLPRRQMLLRIELPIVARQTIPSLLFIQVSMLQATLFASLISVDEIFRVCQQINSQIYRPVQIYTALAVLFLAICLPMNGLAYWLRARFTKNLSDR